MSVEIGQIGKGTFIGICIGGLLGKEYQCEYCSIVGLFPKTHFEVMNLHSVPFVLVVLF